MGFVGGGDGSMGVGDGSLDSGDGSVGSSGSVGGDDSIGVVTWVWAFWVNQLLMGSQEQ